MAATLLLHLVFDVHRARAEFNQRLDRARNVERAAPAGIHIHQQRQRADVGDAPDVDQHVVECADTQIGQAQRARRNAAARQVNRLEAGALGHARGVGIDGAGDLQGFFGGHGGAKARARRDRLCEGACGYIGHDVVTLVGQ